MQFPDGYAVERLSSLAYDDARLDLPRSRGGRTVLVVAASVGDISSGLVLLWLHFHPGQRSISLGTEAASVVSAITNCELSHQRKSQQTIVPVLGRFVALKYLEPARTLGSDFGHTLFAKP